MDAQYWDEKYRSTDQLFSGAPNAVLVAEVAELAPGHALDLGCGEGADAHWLARHGWRVTAVDIAPTALRRAAEAAPELADQVTWTAADITRTPPAPRTYDLVSAHYFPLPRTADHTALHGLLEAVAPAAPSSSPATTWPTWRTTWSRSTPRTTSTSPRRWPPSSARSGRSWSTRRARAPPRRPRAPATPTTRCCGPGGVRSGGGGRPGRGYRRPGWPVPLLP